MSLARPAGRIGIWPRLERSRRETEQTEHLSGRTARIGRRPSSRSSPQAEWSAGPRKPARVGRTTVYDRLNSDPDFAAAFVNIAGEDAASEMEDVEP